MIKAHSLIGSGDFGSAVTALKSLDTKPLLRDNSDLLAMLGEAHFCHGDLTAARTTLQRVTAEQYTRHLCYNFLAIYCAFFAQ